MLKEIPIPLSLLLIIIFGSILFGGGFFREYKSPLKSSGKKLNSTYYSGDFKKFNSREKLIEIVFTTDKARRIPRNVAGFNQNWVTPLNIRSKLIQEAIQRLNVSIIRFPGGTYANYYDWNNFTYFWDRFGKEVRNPTNIIKLYKTHVEKVEPVTFIQLIHSLKKEVTVVVNVYTMSSEEMIKALKNLRDKGVNIKYIELGNEMYHKFYKKTIKNADAYLKRAKKVSDAAKKLFPGVKTAVMIGNEAWRTIDYKPNPEWDIPNEDWWDAAVVHAYIGGGSKLYDINKDRFLDYTLNGISRSYKRLIKVIREKYPKKELWLTEWNIFERNGKARFANTYKNSFIVYDFLLNALKYPEVTMTFLHALFRPQEELMTINSTKMIFAAVYPRLKVAEKHFPAADRNIPPQPIKKSDAYTFQNFFVRGAPFWPFKWIGEIFSKYEYYSLFDNFSEDEDILALYFFNKTDKNSGSIAVINKYDNLVNLKISGVNLINKKIIHKMMAEEWTKISSEEEELTYKTYNPNADNIILLPYSISFIEIVAE